LLLDGGVQQVPFRFVWLGQRQGVEQNFAIAFNAGSRMRRALTARLFTGGYRGLVDEINVPRALFALCKIVLR
jgi:hypothetical protein